MRENKAIARREYEDFLAEEAREAQRVAQLLNNSTYCEGAREDAISQRKSIYQILCERLVSDGFNVNLSQIISLMGMGVTA